MDITTRSILMKIASHMVLGRGMPSDHIEDWELHKTTGVKDRRLIAKRAEIARDQAKYWGLTIADLCRDQD